MLMRASLQSLTSKALKPFLLNDDIVVAPQSEVCKRLTEKLKLSLVMLPQLGASHFCQSADRLTDKVLKLSRGGAAAQRLLLSADRSTEKALKPNCSTLSLSRSSS